MAKVKCFNEHLIVNLANVLISQEYIPTSDHDDAEVEATYNGQRRLQQHYHRRPGVYEIGRRNDRGRMIIDFYRHHYFIVTITWYKKRKMNCMPGKVLEVSTSINQIDYILPSKDS